MKVKISGVEYDFENGVSGAGIGTLRELKRITQERVFDDETGEASWFPGVTPESFTKVDLSELTDNALRHLQALVWIVRRGNGERVTWDECDIPPGQIELIVDDEPEGSEGSPDPKVLEPGGVEAE